MDVMSLLMHRLIGGGKTDSGVGGGSGSGGANNGGEHGSVQVFVVHARTNGIDNNVVLADVSALFDECVGVLATGGMLCLHVTDFDDKSHYYCNFEAFYDFEDRSFVFHNHQHSFFVDWYDGEGLYMRMEVS